MSQTRTQPEFTLDPEAVRMIAERLDYLEPEMLGRLLSTKEGRIALCEEDPVLFALLYLPDTLRNSQRQITLAPVHYEWASLAEQWMKPTTQTSEHRYALLAPRGTGKSSWFYLLLPMWWLAYEHTKFIAAFADSDGQAQLHLQTFKDTVKDKKNAVLRNDFPRLVNAKKNTEGIYIARSGVVFAAKGIDSASLGMKVGDMRPDTLLLDDIESDEGNYSAHKVEKRLITMIDGVFALNTEARVALTGTVTMPGSITHQIIKYNKGYRSKELEWVENEKIQIRHTKPFIMDAENNEISFWPDNPKFDYDSMTAKRHTREFKKNYECDPMATDAEYWSLEDFTYGEFECTRAMISIDGAVTTGIKSDFTGVSVVGYAPPGPDPKLQPGRCLVMFAKAVKLRGDPLRDYVLRLLEQFPQVTGILAESNQAGEMWHDTFHSMPVRVATIHQTERKESRAARALNFYQVHPTRVQHITPLHELEEQMVAFPQAPHDDLVDSVGTAILTYLRPRRPVKSGARVTRPR